MAGAEKGPSQARELPEQRRLWPCWGGASGSGAEGARWGGAGGAPGGSRTLEATNQDGLVGQ